MAGEITFEEMLNSFLGKEIESIEFTEDEELILVLNDESAMVVGADGAGLYLKRLEADLN